VAESTGEINVTTEEPGDSFDRLGLNEPLRQAINEVGYEAPTPIQLKTIPLLLAGHDVIGQAQTGTGKTAAFALPILQRLNPDEREVQALILTPTRELAIQVAEAIHTYAKRMKQVRVLPIYGGQSIQQQIHHLQKGINIVVGTPGRVMDHLRRGTLNFDSLKMVILDEADEMLRMGFIEDVEWILAQAPQMLQTALFSATIPAEIRRIADRYLRQPVTVEIEHKSLAVPTVAQRYLNVSEKQKLDVLSHVLETETEPGEAVLIFARTKVGAADLAEKLQVRGYTVEAMHGDMSQAQRETVIRRLRSGQVEIVVATDVAARGLDVERIGFVINYDIPYDMEAYVHRIGRTGRAGRAGKAVLFVTPREQRLMRNIEQYVKQRIEPMKAPTRAHVAARRIALFKERILQTLEEEELDLYLSLVEELAEESGRDMVEIAAAIARLAREDKPLVVDLEPEPEQVAYPEEGMVRFFIDAGRRNGVRPGDIVGAIANEAGVPGQAIGAIDIYDRFTFVDVPAQYREQVLAGMSGAAIRNRGANIRVATSRDEASGGAQKKATKKDSPKRKDIYRGKKSGKKFGR
jgi:ATP-dependent RNA helicase DeaD